MSLSVSVDGETPEDVATSRDWKNLSKVATGELKTLVEQGYTTDLDQLLKDLEKLVKDNKKPSLTETLKSLKTAAAKASEILIVT